MQIIIEKNQIYGYYLSEKKLGTLSAVINRSLNLQKYAQKLTFDGKTYASSFFQ